MILAHPNMSAEQACQVARRDGLLLVQTKRGNFIYKPSSGSNVHVSSVSRVPLNGTGKQQRINCGRDSRRDGNESSTQAPVPVKIGGDSPSLSPPAAGLSPEAA